jgi:glycosyltransferase involved in cell wall biosynthesis
VHVGAKFAGARLVELRGMPGRLERHIPYGVAEPSASDDAVQALRARLAPDGSLLVGMVSATSEVEKGHGVLAGALERVSSDVRAVVVGAHPGEAFVQRLERTRLSGRVHVAGRVPAADLDAHLLAVDLLVVPSTAYESLPLVILEAMAAGKPVFASRLSGIPEAVEDGKTGCLFEPGAEEELAELLRRAASNREELSRMGEAGRERWERTFSVGAMTTAMLELYDQLASSPR